MFTFNRPIKEEVSRLQSLLNKEKARSAELTQELDELKSKQQEINTVVDGWRERDKSKDSLNGIIVTVKDAPPGSLLLLDNGTIILKSEYSLTGSSHPMAIIEGTGEFYHGDSNKKGRIIDLGTLGNDSQDSETDQTLSANERARMLVAELEKLWNDISIDTMYNLESDLSCMMYEDDLTLKEPEVDLTKDLPSFDERAEAFKAEMLTGADILDDINKKSNQKGGYQPVFSVGKPIMPPKDE